MESDIKFRYVGFVCKALAKYFIMSTKLRGCSVGILFKIHI